MIKNHKTRPSRAGGETLFNEAAFSFKMRGS